MSATRAGFQSVRAALPPDYLRKLRSELRFTPEAVHPSARATCKKREEGRFFSRRELLVGGKAATPAKTAPGAGRAPCTGRRPKNSAKEALAGCWPKGRFTIVQKTAT